MTEMSLRETIARAIYNSNPKKDTQIWDNVSQAVKQYTFNQADAAIQALIQFIQAAQDQ